MARWHLRRVDKVLTELRTGVALPNRASIQELCRGILLHLEIDQVTGGQPAQERIFAQDLSHDKRRFISICLLRLLASARRVFEDDQDFRVHAVTLFDQVLAKDLYKVLDVSANEQTYQKLQVLQSAAPRAEQALGDALKSFASLSAVGQFRQRWMRTLNNGLNRSVIFPFVPRELTDKTRLNELFASISEYTEATPSRKRTALGRARELLQSYKETAQSFETDYSNRFFGRFADLTLGYLDEDLRASPLSRPARLEARASEKKYPLGIVGTKIDLRVVVANESNGAASDVTLFATADKHLELIDAERFLGDLEPAEAIGDLDVPAIVRIPSSSATLRCSLTWHNWDGTKGSKEFTFEVPGQRHDIPWDDLARSHPYSLDPVERIADLAGRREVLASLRSHCTGSSVGSAILYGQRRVGKTSLANALLETLREDKERPFVLVYLEAGEYVRPEAQHTIQGLGQQLCKELKWQLPAVNDVPTPSFEDSLTPLAAFLKDVGRRCPDRRFVFILDEFDSLPFDLCRRSAVADPFFATIRSISGKAPFGFVLVGGENMDAILGAHGQALNKFKPYRLDYFRRDTDWSDYEELVRLPTRQWVNIGDDALAALYDHTGGNPYFTKLICEDLFQLIVAHRDSDVTRREVVEAVRRVRANVGKNVFAHFWDDGIFEKPEKVEERSLRRRKVLILIGEALRESSRPSTENVVSRTSVFNLGRDVIDEELREFARRGVLALHDGIRFSVRVFEDWLHERGVHEIVTTFADADAAAQRIEEEEEQRVRSDEIVELARKWGTYQGRPITEDHIRGWLEQFDQVDEQRLMFKVLQSVQFYGSAVVRRKLQEGHEIVQRELVRRGIIRYVTGDKPTKRDDILVAYADAPGKSGSQYARWYADENRIYARMVQELRAVGSRIREQKVLAVVVVDDFIGTGMQAAGNLAELDADTREFLSRSRIPVLFLCVVGFSEAAERVEEEVRKAGLDVSVHVVDPLDESARVFEPASRVFGDGVERQHAREVAEAYGRRLVPRDPLGFGGCQCAVVFESRCPNDSLPILWKDRDAGDGPWRALFRRL